jgi:8-oxo-dGTP pyrophosphatase MutT (NUDIX family)
MATTKDYAGAHIVLHRLLDVHVKKKCEGEIVHDSVQAILLFKKGQTAPVHAGLWSLVGGKPEKDETDPKVTAIREMREELRICDDLKYPKECDLEDLPPVPVKRQNGKERIMYFSFQLDLDMDTLKLERTKPEKLPKESRECFPEGLVESEGLSWFTAEEVHHLPMRSEDRIAINEFFRENGT